MFSVWTVDEVSASVCQTECPDQGSEGPRALAGALVVGGVWCGEWGGQDASGSAQPIQLSTVAPVVGSSTVAPGVGSSWGHRLRSALM